MKYSKTFKFKFAGSVMYGDLVKVEKIDDVKLYYFQTSNIIYPIRKNNICGSLAV